MPTWQAKGAMPTMRGRQPMHTWQTKGQVPTMLRRLPRPPAATKVVFFCRFGRRKLFFATDTQRRRHEPERSSEIAGGPTKTRGSDNRGHHEPGRCIRDRRGSDKNEGVRQGDRCNHRPGRGIIERRGSDKARSDPGGGAGDPALTVRGPPPVVKEVSC